MHEDRTSDALNHPVTYQIRVEGELEPHWVDWFEGMTLSLDAGDTLLCGEIPDQARLFGMLKKVRDLGLPLVSVTRIPRGER